MILESKDNQEKKHSLEHSKHHFHHFGETQKQFSRIGKKLNFF